MAAYNVSEWGSRPDAENDDCYTGADYDTIEEARAAFLGPCTDTDVHWVQLDGPDVHEMRRNGGYRKPADDDDWQRESAMQAGMGLGVDAYNDSLGY